MLGQKMLKGSRPVVRKNKGIGKKTRRKPSAFPTSREGGGKKNAKIQRARKKGQGVREGETKIVGGGGGKG